MRQFKPTIKTIGENRFYIRPFPAFTAAKMTGDLAAVAAPALAAIALVASGLGGYYPSQIVIGYVEEVRTSDSGLAQYAVIAPEAELDGIAQVFIVTSFDIVD